MRSELGHRSAVIAGVAAIRRPGVVLEGVADIARSPEDVFDYCSDHTREPEWNVKMRHVRKLIDGPIGLGTRYEMEFIPGRPMVVDCVRYDRPTGWQMSGETMGMQVGWGGEVRPAAGGSRLLLRMQLQPHGLLRLIGPLLRRRMQPDLDRDVGAIKARLEGGRRCVRGANSHAENRQHPTSGGVPLGTRIRE